MLHCEQEIIELHQFFEDWFNGRLPQTKTTFKRVAGVLAPEFIIVSPNGRLSNREPLTEGLWQSYGGWQEKGLGRIWIESVNIRWQKRDILLANYEEWQEVAQKITSRLSTVLFERHADLPNGLAWLHVHETWLTQ